MQLKTIDKSRYRKHLNYVIAACVIALAMGSLGISQSLIALFPDQDGSHFHWNLLGVITSCIFIAYVLFRSKNQSFMYEVVYVWELKQALNQITRKMAKLKVAAEQGNENAMLAIQFSYTGSKQLWELDDNTITMDELVVWQAELDALAKRFQVHLDVTQYNAKLLKAF